MEINFNQAMVAHQEGRLKEAEQLYRFILKKEPKNIIIKNNLGVLLSSLGKLDEAKSIYRKIIKLKPDYADAHYNFGNILKDLGRFDEAEKSYKTAIKLNFKNAFIYYNLGVAQQQLDRLEEAEVSYKKAIELKYKFSEVYYNLSILLFKLERFDEAEINYKKAINLKPDYIKINKEFSLQISESNRLDKIINLNPNISKAFIGKNKTVRLPSSQFLSPRPIEYEEFYRKGMGTENVGIFLRSLIQMVRPNKILEIGAGYTTPFILEAIVNNKRIFNDGNLKESYFKNYDYNPKLVIIDDMSLGELKKKPGMNNLINSNYVDFIEGKFQDKTNVLLKKYINFDFVWFDCGGLEEYKVFMDEYWKLCTGYVLFHYTYNDGKPNLNHKIIQDKLKDNQQTFDIIEPHKKRQGSITMINKCLSKNYKN